MSESRTDRTVLCVELEGVGVALDAWHVREVLGAIEVTSIAGGPTGFVGVVPWRGRAVAVLDLSLVLGGVPSTERPRTVFVELDSDVLAIPVDRVHEPRSVESERPAHAQRMPFVSREVDVEGSTLPLFDVAELLRSLEDVAA